MLAASLWACHSSCGEEKPVVVDEWKAKTPADLFRLLKKASMEENYDAFFSLQTEKALKEMDQIPKELGWKMQGLLEMALQMFPEDQRAATRVKIEKDMLKKFVGISSIAEMIKMSGRDFLTLMMKNDIGGMRAPMARSVFVSTKMGPDGKTAVVVVKDHQGNEEPAKVVLVDGGWKLDEFDTGKK